MPGFYVEKVSLVTSVVLIRAKKSSKLVVEKGYLSNS